MTAPDEYDVLDITETEQILTPEELGEAEPETAAEEAPADPAVEPEEASEPDVSEDIAEPEEKKNEDTAEPEDELVGILTSLRDSISAMAARLDTMETRIAESEAREAARGRRLTGFFAPVPDGVKPDPDVDPLPRIEKKYIY